VGSGAATEANKAACRRCSCCCRARLLLLKSTTEECVVGYPGYPRVLDTAAAAAAAKGANC
jgi:hypothetical protein